ncbi:MAG: hypothetical protein HY359_10970 [Candidatus Rokubacteria bacterium]|nr:hypothetical protein [Candidatus Rokubacteria bacterium]
MGRLAVVLLMVGVAGAGCAALGPQPLDLAPGQRVVLGRVELIGFEGAEGLLEIVREDRAFEHALPVGRSASDFAIGLPPGRYRVTRLRAWKDREAVPTQVVWDLAPLVFVVGPDPAVYIGTLKLGSNFGRVQVSVVDELEATLRVLRAWYPNLPAIVVRALVTPA